MAWIVAGLLVSPAVAEGQTQAGTTVELKYGGTAFVEHTVGGPSPAASAWPVDGTWLRVGDRYRSEAGDTYIIDWPGEDGLPGFVPVRDLLALPLNESGEFALPADHEIERRFRLSNYGSHGSQPITDSDGNALFTNGSLFTDSLGRGTGVAVDAEGNVFAADTDNHRIRWIEAGTGIIRILAGTGERGFGGDGGPATEASLFFPRGLAVDADGNVYSADTNNRLRSVDVVTGGIETIARTEGVVIHILSRPRRVAIDSAGSLYVLEPINLRLRKIDRVTSRTETLLADPRLRWATGMAVDRTGRFFITTSWSFTVGGKSRLLVGEEIPFLKVSAGLSGELLEFTIEEDGVLRLDGNLVLKGSRALLGGRDIELAEGIQGGVQPRIHAWDIEPAFALLDRDAIQAADLGTIAGLLRKGGSVRARNGSGQTALHLAAETNSDP